MLGSLAEAGGGAVKMPQGTKNLPLKCEELSSDHPLPQAGSSPVIPVLSESEAGILGACWLTKLVKWLNPKLSERAYFIK